MSWASRCQRNCDGNSAVVGLHDVNAKRQALPPHVVNEPHRRALVAGIVNLEDANASAVVNRRELAQPFVRARDPLEELHVQLRQSHRLRSR
jgi:hypothetical protein